MTATLTKVDYPDDGAVRPGRQIAITSALGFDETTAALEAAIVAEDMWVLSRVETQMLVAKGGFAIRPLRQIFFFHARFMVRLLAQNPAAIVEVPLKFVIMAAADGSVTVRHPDIEAAFASYPELAALAAELASIVGKITSMIPAQRADQAVT